MTEEQLNELSIFALRELARRTGVYAPTSKKKSELIKNIIEISEGKKEPYIAKTKQGRPPKDGGYSFADILMPKSHFNFAQNSNINSFSQKRAEFKYDDIKTVSGFVELLSNNTAFLWVGKQENYLEYFIPEDIVKKHNIKMGDKLLVELSSTENQTSIKEVFTINDIPIKKYNNARVDYYEIEHVEPANKIPFDNEEFNSFDIKFGESVYLYGSDNKVNTESIIEIMNSALVDKKIYINVSIAEKNKYLLKKIKNSELFISSITAEMDSVKRLVNVAIERAKRLLEKGENVLMAIDDVLSLSGVDSLDLNLTKNLLSLTKCGKNSGTISVFAIMPGEKNLNLFEKLVDKRINISDDKLTLIQ